MNSKESDAATKIAAKKMAVIADWVWMIELEEDVDLSKSKVGMPKAKVALLIFPRNFSYPLLFL